VGFKPATFVFLLVQSLINDLISLSLILKDDLYSYTYTRMEQEHNAEQYLLTVVHTELHISNQGKNTTLEHREFYEILQTELTGIRTQAH